jgi:hypothetical protein
MEYFLIGLLCGFVGIFVHSAITAILNWLIP